MARVYDFWLGGTDNFAADRAVAEQVAAAYPDVLIAVQAQRGGVLAAGDLAGNSRRRCRLTSAGHLPPALRHPGGSVEFLDLPGGVMLGVAQGDYAVTDTDLPGGSVLALYTDGLIEQPGQDLSTGMSQLARALAAG
jgi:Stage II sporulation protein E (SpoIIE)/S-adenosyl methyltransferase